MKSRVSDLSSQIKKTRVCLFSTVQPPDDVRLFHRECKSLVASGYDVHLVVPCEGPALRDGVQFHAIHRPRSRLVRMTVMPWVAMRRALATNAAIYHFHDPELLFAGFVMRWFLSKKLVFDMRESTARQIMTKEWLPKCLRKIASLFYRVIENICLRGIAVIVANDKSKEENEPCYLVRNFPKVDEELMANAMGMDKRLEQPLLVYVGGVAKIRGALLYVELAKRLLQRGYSFEMMIIGAYEDNFGRHLKAKVRQLNLQDRVTVTGRMDYREAMKITSRAVIGLSILEPIPNFNFCLAGKIVEYMMCGTPVLCSRFGHWRAYVEDEGTGMMADPTNIDEVVKVCERMLSNPDELAAMGKRGIEVVRTKYNWDTEFKVLLRCYEDLLKK